MFARMTENTENSLEWKILKGPTVPTDDSKIGKVIFDALNETPDYVSQIDAETGYQNTCAKMKDRSIRLAIWMKNLGIRPDDVIVEFSPYQLDSYVPLFATFFLDAIFTAWPYSTKIGEVQKLMQRYEPKLIFVDEERVELMLKAAKLENSNVKLIVMGKHSKLQSLNEILSFQTEEEVENFILVNDKSPHEAALIMVTSGTTGFSKPVLFSSQLVSKIVKGDSCIDPSQTPRVLCHVHISSMGGLRLTLQSVVQKYTIVVASGYNNEHQFLKIIEKNKVNAARVPSILLNSVAKFDSLKNYNLESLKIFYIAGSIISRSILEKLYQNFPTTSIRYYYGMTEAGGIVSDRTSECKHIDSVGFPIQNVEVKFVDLESNENLGPNMMGEIYVKTPRMMRGYYNDLEATRQVLDEDGWYRTGDLGKYDDNGEMFFIDRIRNIIKYKNHSIVPSEIEAILLSHPGVEQAAVVPIRHECDGEWPLAFVKILRGKKVSKSEITKLMSTLGDEKQLRGGIYFIDDLPLTATRKISKNILKEMAEDMTNPKMF